jgi:hypothetical protein
MKPVNIVENIDSGIVLSPENIDSGIVLFPEKY